MVQCAKPEWVSHENGQPIFSIDVHPDGTRFATAGNDNKAKIWNLQPCLDEAAENNPAVVRTLATLSGHEGSVNCVRWSPNGRLLASCSDDQLVMLWRLAAPGERLGAMPFGSGAAPNVERWRCVATLRGHSGDVVGVAWAPDARRLASVSLDNTVRVWEASANGDSFNLLKVLEGHQGMAKGVAWDPIGRYIASQGDDKSAILWDAREWREAARVEQPFQVRGGIAARDPPARALPHRRLRAPPASPPRTRQSLTCASRSPSPRPPAAPIIQDALPAALLVTGRATLVLSARLQEARQHRRRAQTAAGRQRVVGGMRLCRPHRPGRVCVVQSTHVSPRGGARVGRWRRASEQGQRVQLLCPRGARLHALDLDHRVAAPPPHRPRDL